MQCVGKLRQPGTTLVRLDESTSISRTTQDAQVNVEDGTAVEIVERLYDDSHFVR